MMNRGIIDATDSTMRMSTENGYDTTDFSKKRKEAMIIKRRGAFFWLPVQLPNDLNHGSWYFVWGSFFWMIFPIFPLINMYHPFIESFDHDDTPMPMLKKDITYALLIASGLLFTLGSAMFVRATEEPRPVPLFVNFEHFATDELLGAWIYFFGSLPLIPYTLLFLIPYHLSSIEHWATIVLSILSVVGCFLFVLACYPTPSGQERYQYSPVLFRACCGVDSCIHVHVQNDWLTGTWVFYYASLISVIGSAVMLVIKLYAR